MCLWTCLLPTMAALTESPISTARLWCFRKPMLVGNTMSSAKGLATASTNLFLCPKTSATAFGRPIMKPLTMLDISNLPVYWKLKNCRSLISCRAQLIPAPSGLKIQVLFLNRFLYCLLLSLCCIIKTELILKSLVESS